ncbi:MULTISPECIES: UbiD family decarboxylase [unclassified Paenibacillus]|uniref:UbiD family decarboxylase n=1 Tax=unclassified Paenibacillus TaxID=185978 RepID=UPI001AE98DC3|nr:MULTISPECIES: UbiD family decarboxylase [unclassified Paenibacillus]MBP1154051.1 4-hydroxy-3-polyprenylbenzoate decarboxylase [Paenibacillus sp. PvP091]MBP1170564.1 4-hydroxy-3-polyprenylbenzoate decarboxylase [Paenibacillus sp. PvR098]MBP2441592.1 4-hydroxy-3-polyprenylbenzoate decarboxylase [Paenibacillus sp. PvP052]
MDIRFDDLRGWIEDLEEKGEIRTVSNASLHEEVPALIDWICHQDGSPALLIDKMKDCENPLNIRFIVNLLGAPERLAYTFGLSARDKMGLVKEWKGKLNEHKQLPYKVVADGPILQNRLVGDEIDLTRLPIPKWHQRDGGAYIGTGNVVVTQDPDTGWVNLGTYRGQILGKNLVGNYVEPGKHAKLHREQWWAKGKPAPFALILGSDPLHFVFSSTHSHEEVCEYDLAGGLRGRPTEVVISDLTGLPIPAGAEIVLEGFMHPGEELDEGPFGEWTGYYAKEVKPEPVIRIERILYRDNPIIHAHPPVKPPSTITFYRAVEKSAEIWNALEAVGVPDVRGVWCHEAGGTRLFNIISIKQRYAGHAKQAALIASQCNEGVRMGRYVVVVDEDIDPTNLGEVIWAMSTRTDPEKSIDIIRRTYNAPLDPAMPEGQKLFTSRAIIDACRPYEWKDKFSPVIETDAEQLRNVEEKYRHLLERQSLVKS